MASFSPKSAAASTCRTCASLGDTPPGRDESLFVAANGNGETIARFAWTPNRPGAKIVSTVLPFIIFALAGFAR